MIRDPLRMLEALYDSWTATTAATPDMTLDEVREMFDHWGDVTAEPGGVDYVEGSLGDVATLWALPREREGNGVLLCFHGGGYVAGSPWSHRKLYGHVARATGCRAAIIDYARAPEHPHPAPVEDVVRAWAGLLNAGEAQPGEVAFVGDSAGGALTITAMLLARSRGLPLPAAAVPIAPYIDMEATGESYNTNAAKDRLGDRDATLQFVSTFMGDGDRRDPLASPLYADLAGLPPILIQTGGDDVLLSESERFHALAFAAGVDCTLEVEPGMQHVYHFLAGRAHEADAAIARIAAWLKPRLGS